MLKHRFPRQAVTAASIEELACCQANVCSFVDSYGCAADVREWNTFFEEIIPKDPIAQGTLPIKDSDNWLLKLYTEFGGPPKRKSTEHLRERETLSKFAEPCHWPDAPWSKSERDKTAEYAIATDVNSSLLIERTDIKRKRKNSAGAKPVLVPKRKNTKSKKKKVTIHPARSDGDSACSMQSPRKKPRGRPPKNKPVLPNSDMSVCSSVDVDDCMSACSVSTGISSLASSKLDCGDSDIDPSGYWEASTCDDECSVVTDASDYSYINLPDIPANMKGKDVAQAFWKMIGRRFLNADDDEEYIIIHVCEIDYGGTRATRMLDKLCFRYALAALPTVTTDDLEIALCSEMMDCDWVCWLEDDGGEEKA